MAGDWRSVKYAWRSQQQHQRAINSALMALVWQRSMAAAYQQQPSSA